ncbi:MAG TPA: DUF1501 domain-containing protein [Armatimonadaceae bacterium]|nr:DUF1501 domain-containing protein [Armatimonadaceae bacterium]
MAENNVVDPNACREYNRFTRRELLSSGVKVGMLSALGLSMTEYLAMSSASAAGLDGGAATSAVLIWLGGGPSHLDTFDLKPDAPVEIRGAFSPMKTKVPGMEISEHLPLLAQQADKIALIRSMTSPEAAHERGTHYMMTGFEPLPGFGVPSYGSVTASQLKPRSALPPYIAIPQPVMYGGAGFLGAALDPFAPGGDPNNANFQVRDLELPNGVTAERMDRRRTLREAVDAAFTRFEKGSDPARTVNAFYQQAYNLLSSSDARAAFDLKKEKDDLRSAYGRTQLGQGLLLARRLVEGGVRFVTVSSGGWDTHNNGFNALKNNLLPNFDKALAAFLNDLHQRGLLQKTLVMVMGEFGRTPVVNRDGGRDHHARCFSVLLAGGGIKGGTVVGASDNRGFEPSERPVRPEDLSATIYHCLGIDYTQSISSPEGVRVTLSRGGRPVDQALA